MIIPQLFIVMIITFSLMHIAPGDPVEMFFGGPEGDQELVAQLVEEYGFNKPIWQQFLIWAGKLMKGDLGYSFVTNRPVSSMIMERLGNTLTLMATSVLIAIIVGILLGTISAYKQYSFTDNATRIFVIFGTATPAFWIGLMAMLVFGVWLGWLPVSGIMSLGIADESWSVKFMDRLWHMVLPVSILSYRFMATYTRQMRANMLQVLNQDYIRTARAKGLKEMIVVGRHAMKNALLPIVTIIGMSIGTIISGAVIIETIFSWPGLGSLTIQSVLRRDYSVIMAIVLMLGVMIVLANLITDLAYSYLDPRIEY
jgi:peptide/nickel transport system permease protein